MIIQSTAFTLFSVYSKKQIYSTSNNATKQIVDWKTCKMLCYCILLHWKTFKCSLKLLQNKIVQTKSLFTFHERYPQLLIFFSDDS